MPPPTPASPDPPAPPFFVMSSELIPPNTLPGKDTPVPLELALVLLGYIAPVYGPTPRVLSVASSPSQLTVPFHVNVPEPMIEKPLVLSSTPASSWQSTNATDLVSV
jgi:hypothetical protein